MRRYALSELSDDLMDPSMDEYDPARRRLKWAYDPSRRKRRKGRMPAGLRRYWAAKRAGKASYHPRHRRHRRIGVHRRHDPARRRFRGFHIGRRRRHDPAFGSAGGWMDIGSDYLANAGGSMLHNFVVQTKGFLSGIVSLGPVNITQAGALAVGLGILAEKFGWIKQNGLISMVAKGVFSEGLNAPGVESVSRQQSNGYMGSYTNAGVAANPLMPGSGPYYTPPWYSM